MYAIARQKLLTQFAVAALGGLALSAMCRAQSGDSQLSSMEMGGTVGPYRIGLNYTVRNDTNLQTAHYFYVSQGKNIPLTGTVQGETLDWQGADGSLFHLHFYGNGSEGKQPLNLYNSLGLNGTWTLGAKTLPVHLENDHSTANPGTRLYADVTSASDASFEAMVASTLKAIASGNRGATASHTHFPLRVNGSPVGLVRTPAELNANWSKIFTPAVLSKTKNDVTHEMFVHEGMATPDNGTFWFDDKGLISVNLSK